MFNIDDRMFVNPHKRARSRVGRHFLGLSHQTHFDISEGMQC